MTESSPSRPGLVPGGKSLSGDGSHSPVVQTRVAARTRDTLQQVAADAGVGVSKLVRPAVEDQVQYFVLWEQKLDAAQSEWEFVRFNKPLTLEQAQPMFEHYCGLAERDTINYRRVQIRRGRDLVVAEWPEAVR